MPQLVRLNNGFLSAKGSPVADCYDVTGVSDDDQEPFGTVPVMQCLGLASLPYPPSDEGYAEGILIEGVGGLPGIIVGAWDTRTFSIFGTLEPGDTVLHSTGPNKAAQCLLKEKKKQAALMSKGPDGKQMMVLVDGKNGKIQLLAFGNVIEMSKDGINLSCGANGITITDDGVHIRGTVLVGGMVAPPGMCMAVASPASWGALSALAGSPITPIMGATGGL